MCESIEAYESLDLMLCETQGKLDKALELLQSLSEEATNACGQSGTSSLIQKQAEVELFLESVKS